VVLHTGPLGVTVEEFVPSILDFNVRRATYQYQMNRELDSSHKVPFCAYL
jgi:hypothetical protein